MEYPSFFMEIHEDTIRLKQDHSHYLQVQGEMGVMGCDWCHFVVCTEGGLFVEEIPFDGHLWKDTMLPNLITFYIDKLVPEILCHKIQQNLMNKSKQLLYMPILLLYPCSSVSVYISSMKCKYNNNTNVSLYTAKI